MVGISRHRGGQLHPQLNRSSCSEHKRSAPDNQQQSQADEKIRNQGRRENREHQRHDQRSSQKQLPDLFFQRQAGQGIADEVKANQGKADSGQADQQQTRQVQNDHGLQPAKHSPHANNTCGSTANQPPISSEPGKNTGNDIETPVSSPVSNSPDREGTTINLAANLKPGETLQYEGNGRRASITVEDNNNAELTIDGPPDGIKVETNDTVIDIGKIVADQTGDAPLTPETQFSVAINGSPNSLIVSGQGKETKVQISGPLSNASVTLPSDFKAASLDPGNNPTPNADQPIPVEPDGGIGDGAGPIPIDMD